MSLDRIQSKEGLLSLTPLNTAAGNPGSVDFNGVAGTVAQTSTDGGGAIFMRKIPRATNVQTLTNGATVTHNNAGNVAVDQAAAVTGIIMQTGGYHGQLCWIVNTSAANTIAFAASGTSNVATGISAGMGALKAGLFIWNGITRLWYQA